MISDSESTVVKHFFNGVEQGEIVYDKNFVATCEEKVVKNNKKKKVVNINNKEKAVNNNKKEKVVTKRKQASKSQPAPCTSKQAE